MLFGSGNKRAVAKMKRREFLERSGRVGSAMAGLLAGGATAASAGRSGKGGSVVRSVRGVSILRLPDDPVAAAAPVTWAVGQLQAALAARGVPARLCERLQQVPAGDVCLLA